jgi:hypothetical protein
MSILEEVGFVVPEDGGFVVRAIDQSELVYGDTMRRAAVY